MSGRLLWPTWPARSRRCPDESKLNMCIVMNAFPVSVACYIHLSPFPSLLPLSFPIGFTFPAKCFYSQFTGSKVFLNLSYLDSLLSCSAVYETRSCVYLCLPRSFYLLSSSHSIFFLSSSRDLSFSFHPSLSSSVFLSSSFPSCRAHNCIIERLFSQLTLSPPSVPTVTFLTFPVSIRTHISILEQNCIISSYLQRNGTKRTT